MKTRAIYVPDIRYDSMPIFELQGNKFVCIPDNELQYDVDVVIADDDWVIVSIDEDGDSIYNARK